jgi:hypothetical protein
LNHLVPREQLRAKTMELARMIAGNNRASVIGIKALLLDQMGQNLEKQWNKERHYTTHVVRRCATASKTHKIGAFGSSLIDELDDASLQLVF